MSLKSLRKSIEVQLIRLGLVMVPRLPRGLVVMLARTTGWVGYYVAFGSRRIGMANLDLAFGETMSASRKKAILKESFQTFTLVLLDVLWFTRNAPERLKRYIQIEPELREKLDQPPVICITGHLGNWESVGQAVANAGFPLHSVAKPLSNPGVDRLFIPSRQLTGQTILSSKGALRPLLRLLRKGGLFAILLDQNTKPSDGGVFVPFFGLPAPISTGAAMLALRTHSNILFGFCLPRRDGTYHIHSPRWIPASELARYQEDPKTAIDRLTVDIAAILEDTIRAYPGNWLWMYKRWKYIAPEHSPADYPFYAKRLGPKEQDKARTTGLSRAE